MRDFTNSNLQRRGSIRFPFKKIQFGGGQGAPGWLDFISGCDLRVIRSSLMLDSTLGVELALDSVSLLPLSTCSYFLSLKKNQFGYCVVTGLKRQVLE